MAAYRIIITSIVAAILYGILHDQVTARICVEYFTIGHPRILDSDSPTILGLVWGVLATWWVGLLLGIGLAVAARKGARPRLDVIDLRKPIAILMLSMFAVAIVAGFIGNMTAKSGTFVLVEPLASRVPADRHVAFLTCGWAHSASYLAGALGGIVLFVRTWKRRGRMESGADHTL